MTDENQPFKHCTVPWNEVYDMAKLMFLIYDYVGTWGQKGITRLLANVRRNENTEATTVEILAGIQARYPDAEIIKYFSNRSGLQCIVGRNPAAGRITIIFRGTDSYTDVLHDLLVIKKDLGSGIKVHRGFHAQLTYNNLLIELVQLVRKETSEHPGWRVYICGHSLGGAIATLASYVLAKTFTRTSFHTFAFASPKCGNTAFKTSFESLPNVKMLRIRYGRDIVTALPTFWYSHVGPCITFKKPERRWVYENSARPAYIYQYYNVFDHRGKNYLEAVKEEAGRVQTVSL